MTTVLKSLGGARRASVALLGVSLLALSIVSSRAYSTVQFNGVQWQIQDDIATLVSQPSLTRADRLRLRTLHRGSNALTKVSTPDGKMLRSLNSILGRQESYLPTLGALRSNLLTGFNAEAEFVENLLLELPESPEATEVKAQFQKFSPTAAKLNAAATLAKFSGQYDATKRKLDDIFIRASQALLVPFPAELSTNSVSAKINNVNFKTSSRLATDNVFSAVTTGTNLSMTLGALMDAGGSGRRGILFSIPNAPFGAFRYPIPNAAVFTNRTAIYLPEESNVAATNGAIFINTTATEVYGSFSCSGPGFNITDGKFRITISNQP